MYMMAVFQNACIFDHLKCTLLMGMDIIDTSNPIDR